METEEKLSGYIVATQFEDLPTPVVDLVKNQALGILGTAIAGARQEGCGAVVSKVKEWGGKEEATLFVYGGKAPSYNAVFANGLMARALDYDDAMSPGFHAGGCTVPTALAVSESCGGKSGKEFLTALAVGAEVGARLRLTEQQYDGFDATGFCGAFASAAIAGRLLGLNSAQILHALALAFTRCGGSVQSNIDGALSARLIQGFAAKEGVICAELAAEGITGPVNFIEGVWGYIHLYGKDEAGTLAGAKELGERYVLMETMFKRYPSCAGTFGSTDAALALRREIGLDPETVDRIDVYVTPYFHKMVGHPFKIGATPRVNAQFSIQYCVANALLRGEAKLQHFEEEQVRDAGIMQLVRRIFVVPDPGLEEKGHTSARMELRTKDRRVHRKDVEVASGFPGNALRREDHIARFWDCINYAGDYFERENGEKLLDMVEGLETVRDIRVMIPLLVAGKR